MDSLSFWAHSKSMLQRSIKDFHLGHDMAIGAGLAVATILLQVWWKLIPFQDWESHKWLLIASAVLPFIIVLLLHIAYRLITAPWRVYQDQEREHSSQISKLAAELTNTKGELREHLERHDAPELMLQWQWDSRVPNGPL